jgi:hypothetical protein
MSAKFTAWFGGEKFEVEITQGGEMAFLDRDMEYEIAFGAMAGEKTRAVRLLEEWQKFPMTVIYSRLEVPIDTILRYMDDLERMTGQYGIFGFTVSAQNYLEAARGSAKALISHMLRYRDTFLSDVAWKNSGHFHGIASGYAATTATQQVADEGSPAWYSAFDREKSRQLRHFILGMEALQVGKPWPEIPLPEVTP